MKLEFGVRIAFECLGRLRYQTLVDDVWLSHVRFDASMNYRVLVDKIVDFQNSRASRLMHREVWDVAGLLEGRSSLLVEPRSRIRTYNNMWYFLLQTMAHEQQP